MNLNIVMLKNIWYMILESDLFTIVILLLITLISIYTWAIIIRKYFRFRLLRRQSERILTYFRGKPALQVLNAQLKSIDHPLIRILTVIRNSLNSSKQSFDLSAIQVEVDAGISSILEFEERHIDFLATTSNVAPFLGLLGTIWGITDCFFQIGRESSANIAVVAPGLSEALITTIFGIVAAIPAFLTFNYFRGEMRHLESELESFAKNILTKAIQESQ